MPARSRARKRALDILYAADLRGQDAVAALDQRIEAGEGPSNPYVAYLVRGVAEHQARIDELLEGLRIGVFELLWAEDVPDPVAVDEAVSLVRDLSTDDSPAFVNGVLGAMLRSKADIVA